MLLALILWAAPAHARVSITMNTGQIFGTIDPAKIKDYTDYLAAVNLYEGLTTISPAGEAQPLIADHWEVATDQLTYRFHIAPDASFQSGTRIRAEDVVWSIQRLLALDQGPSFLFQGLLSPDNVRAIDPETVELRLNKIFSPFLACTPLLFVLDKAAIEAKAAQGDRWGEAIVGDQALGSGPYRLGKWSHAGTMVLERNEAYHLPFGDKPIDEVRLITTDEEATVKAMTARGELQMTSDLQSDETYQAIAQLPNYRVTRTPTATALYIKLNHKVAPTDDIHIRRAIAYALDTATIIEDIYPGEKLRGPLPSLFADPADGLSAIPFDLAKAADEVKQSRYAGKGPIPLIHVIAADTAFEEDIALLLKSTLDTIGFDVSIRAEAWDRIVELAAKPESTPASSQILVSPTYASPDSMLYAQYDSHAAGTYSSMSWLDDPVIDGLIDDARRAPEAVARRKLYDDVARRLVDDQTDVFVLAETERHGMSKCLEGYQYYPIQSFGYNFSKLRWVCG